MLKPGHLLVVLATAGTVLTAICLLQSQKFSSAAAVFLIGFMLVDGLWEGEIGIGLRSFRKSFRRKDTPFAFWSIVCLHVGALIITAAVALYRGATR